jgi:hypothetical protein
LAPIHPPPLWSPSPVLHVARAETVLPMMGGGYATKTSFPGGRMAVADRKPRPLSRRARTGVLSNLLRFIFFSKGGRKERKKNQCFNSVWLVYVQMNLMVCMGMRWWEKGVQPNMREVESARDLANSLRGTGDQLIGR